MNLLTRAPRNLFFTGKGGVGKTSVACATALALAEHGRQVLLVSTDPASNLDEVLETSLGSEPRLISTTTNLFALNIDPIAAARLYRENVVGPYRGLLPDAAVRSIEEQLSGACTVEIAAFDQFAKLLADPKTTSNFDHVVFDTAPTGHTLRLLELPSAWSGYLQSAVGGTSCLGPLAGLQLQQGMYTAARQMLCDNARTSVVLVARPEPHALREAERTHQELLRLGLVRQELVINGVFHAIDTKDSFAVSLEHRGALAMNGLTGGLATLPRTELPLLPIGVIGLTALRRLFSRPLATTSDAPLPPFTPLPTRDVTSLLPELARVGRGVILTMGKGGVGKTSVALGVALSLARGGHNVHLTTTDPAARIVDFDAEPRLRVSRIDPQAAIRTYTNEIMRTAGAHLDLAGRALLEEDLKSPCTEEIAVFMAFARVVDESEHGFVVIDTAPTGHTILLLDAAESYHKEVLRTSGHAPDEVKRLLPRLRDPEFTKILLVTLPEATPVHEAETLQHDLERAGIVPFAWVVNQSFMHLAVSDPTLVARRKSECKYYTEVLQLSERVVVLPWSPTMGQHDGGEDAIVQSRNSSSTYNPNPPLEWNHVS